MDSPRNLPWQSWEEWGQVYHAIFTPGLQAAALARVAAWRARGRCPHAVEATAVLVELSLSDPAVSGIGDSSYAGTGTGAAGVAEPVLRGAYAMAVVRALNGLVDAGQQRGPHASSVQALAKRVGLPTWVVELRHDAAHNSLPSLPLLRLASASLMRYLERKYWAAQQSQLDLIKQLCSGIVRRFVSSHRAGIDEGALKLALADVPPTALAVFFVPVLVGGRALAKSTPTAAAGAALSPDSPLVAEGALAPTHAPETHPPTPEGINVLYWRFLPLLLALQARWAGFSEALLSSLVAAIIEEAQGPSDDADSSNTSPTEVKTTTANMPAAFAAAEAAAAASRAEAAAQAAAARRYFCEAWVRLLLSREWLGRLLAPVEASVQEATSMRTTALTETAAGADDNGTTASAKNDDDDAASSFLRTLALNPGPSSAGQRASAAQPSNSSVSDDSATAAPSTASKEAAAAADTLSIMAKGGVVLRHRGRDRWTTPERMFMLSQASRPTLIAAGLLVESSPLATPLLATSAAGRLMKLADWLADHAVPTSTMNDLESKSCFSTLRRSLKPPDSDDAPSPLAGSGTAVGGAAAASGGVAGRRARVLARVSGSGKRHSTTSENSTTGASPDVVHPKSALSDTTTPPPAGHKAAAVGQKRSRDEDCGVWQHVNEWSACALGALPGQNSASLTATNHCY